MLLVIFLLIGFNSICQTSVESDSTLIQDTSSLSVDNSNVKYFQYRISIEEITTSSVSKMVEPQMFDIFRVQISFNENLKQFIFVSSEDIDSFSLHKTFYNYQISYFKKIPIKTQ